ncbi:MAG: TldD/PmbA family protein [Candidatus Latescibacteria bacterium]|nr:TldD/PmbA family protein [Candidatus Latescibacterota bacterium]
MKQIMKKAIESLDADYAEIRFSRSETTGISYMGAELEDIGTTFSLGGCIRICIKGGWGFSSFNRIEDAAACAKKACMMAELTQSDRTILAPVNPVVASIKWEGYIDPSAVSLEEKVYLVKSYNDRMLKAKDIVTTNSVYRDGKKTTWLLTSEGTYIEKEEVRTGVSLMAVAKDGGNVQRGRKSFGDQRGYKAVTGLEGEVEKVIKVTRDLIKAPKVDGGVYPVILDPQLAGVFVHEAFGHLSEADFVYENPQAREMMKIGRRFGPDFLNIIDDGTLLAENGYVPYDEEGVPGQRSFLIKDGILAGRLHSRETAARLDEKPTGNARAISTSHRPIVRMTTTFIDNGESSFESMISGIKNGIYACDFLGGMTDLERFTFSSAYAYKIENGKITTPLRDVILSGNVFETLKNISMVGNDLKIFGGLGGCGKGGQSPLPVSDGSPHICVNNVLVG